MRRKAFRMTANYPILDVISGVKAESDPEKTAIGPSRASFANSWTQFEGARNV